MPVCHKCGRMQSSAEMRRSTTPGLWVCKEQAACNALAKKINKQRKEAKRA